MEKRKLNHTIKQLELKQSSTWYANKQISETKQKIQKQIQYMLLRPLGTNIEKK